jgi:hypothetical protein
MAVNPLEAARKEIGLSLDDLWIRYFALGGNAEPLEVNGYLSDLLTLEIREHNVLALALNEAFSDLGMDHPVEYRVPPGI